jgi:O-antigen ligase
MATIRKYLNSQSALLLFAITLPWSLAAMQISLLLIVIFVSLELFRREIRFDLTGRLWFFSTIYVGLYLLAAVWSPAPLKALKSIVQNEWILLTLPFLFLALKNAASRKSVVIAFIVSASLAGVYGIIQFFDGVEYFRGKQLAQMGAYYRATGGFGFYLTFAGNQLLAFGVTVGVLMCAKLSAREKQWLAVGGILILLSILATFARSTWLAVGVMMVLAMLQLPKRYRLPVFLGFVTTALLAIALIPEVRLRLLSLFDAGQNETRVNLWLTSLKMIAAHPLLGIGPGFFRDVFDAYKVEGFYDTIAHAHNDYLNLAANAGILTLLGWLAIWGEWFAAAIRAIRISGDNFEKSVVWGALLSMSGILFAALFQCYYTDLENNIVWWFVAMLGYQSSQALLHNKKGELQPGNSPLNTQV